MKSAVSHVGRVLIADDEERIRNILAIILQEEGYDVRVAHDGADATSKAATFQPHVIIADLQMPRMDGVETILEIRKRLPRTVGIILTAHGTIASAVQAIKRGIYDYIQKPFDNEHLLAIVRRATKVSELLEEVETLKRQIQKRYDLSSIIGESVVMERVRQEIGQIAQTDATVLIEGESGTGKELAARAIHSESKRRDNSLVIVDCTAVPPNLIESEFFGYERGAFTDARETHVGKFEEAHSGTIFLDEIGELPPEAQTKLLRVLQEKEVTRVGSAAPIQVDVRIIAATNKRLEQQVQEGKFREDLFYRLNVLKLIVPPLRDHAEDIPSYVDHFLAKHRETFRKEVRGISHAALHILACHEWKGNIRELENVVQRAMLSASGMNIGVEDLGFLTQQPGYRTARYDSGSGLEAYIRSLTEQAERQCILKALEENNGNRTDAAEKLKISRKTLFNKMRQYGLDSQEDMKNSKDNS